MKIISSVLVLALVAAGSMSCKCSSQNRSKAVDGALDNAHNSMNSLDWAGTYKGVTPEQGTEGIETSVVLRFDNTYSYYTRKAGNNPVQVINGTFSWKEDGNTIVLESNMEGSKLYAVGENGLKQIDMNGNKSDSSLDKHYTLGKVEQTLTERYWKLVELGGEAIVLDANFNREPHLIFKQENSRVTGNAGCNTINSSYTVDGDKLTFGLMASTMMACPNLEIENKFTAIFEKVTSYVVENDQLMLRNADGINLAKFDVVYLY